VPKALGMRCLRAGSASDRTGTHPLTPPTGGVAFGWVPVAVVPFSGSPAKSGPSR